MPRLNSIFQLDPLPNAPAKLRGQEATPLAVAIRAKRDKTAEFLKSRGGRALSRPPALRTVAAQVLDRYSVAPGNVVY